MNTRILCRVSDSHWNPVMWAFFMLMIFSFVQETPGKQTKTENPDSTSDHARSASESEPSTNEQKLIASAVEELLQIQNEDGAWPYEGVYRVRGKIPVGYRIGGTAIVCSALISSGLDRSADIENGIIRGTEMILKELEEPLMKPSRTGRYDVRIWGHIYALDYFCRLQAVEGFDELKSKTEPQIKKLADAVVFQEIANGGWNYANKSAHCCFVTAPAVQSLLLAKQQGVEVPEEVLLRSAEILESSRLEKLVFPYSGTSGRRDTTAGSIARGPVSETTLMLLGCGNEKKLQDAIDAFHKHWDELEKRRKKTGTHVGPHGIAPYYFYYAHRYAAQAIRMLPNELQQAEFEKFAKVLLKTKDSDDTWNDRVFDRSKAYGTAMSVLALAQESVQLPRSIRLTKNEQEKP